MNNSDTTTENAAAPDTARLPAARKPAKHEALRRALAEMIDEGLAPHQLLPSERELMLRYDVSRMTVRRAVERLVQEGRVYRVQGAGTYVAERSTISKSLRLSSFSEDIRARRMVPDSRLVSLGLVPADLACARDLRLAPGSEVVHMERLRTADREPMCLENVWLPPSLVPGLVAEGDPTSLYQRLETAGAAPQTADQTIRATVLDARQAELLDVPPHFPALEVERVTRDTRGPPVERAVSLYRADRYDFKLTISRGEPQ